MAIAKRGRNEFKDWWKPKPGEDLQTRKEYIKDNLHKYKMED